MGSRGVTREDGERLSKSDRMLSWQMAAFAILLFGVGLTALIGKGRSGDILEQITGSHSKWVDEQYTVSLFCLKSNNHSGFTPYSGLLLMSCQA